MANQWEKELQEYRAKHYHVLTRGDLAHISLEALIAETSASQSTQIFLRQLSDPQVPLWDAFIHSIGDLQENELFAPLKPLLLHVTHLALLYGEEDFFQSPDKWSYLIEINDLWGPKTSGYFLLHPPALHKHIQQAEAVLGTPLPPTFVRFLNCTNGLGIYSQELFYVNGVGEARAFWHLLTDWSRPTYHEIASEWWRWQDLYADERQRDQEEGIIADRSDEQAAIPFAQTSDAWCFDRSKPDKTGEYPVFYWDHEQRLREEGVEYPSFEAWFLDEIIGGKLFEDDYDPQENV